MEDDLVDNAGFDPVEFELANGNKVRIAFGKFWERLTDLARFAGDKPGQFYAIRIYSNEGVLSNQMTVQSEFRARHEFGFVALPQIWEWLESLTENRGHLKFDTFEEFVEEFAEQISILTDSDEDAVEHFRHLPEITDPESFDKVDDSVFNDQNENEPGI
jgi:hypothetical protein